MRDAYREEADAIARKHNLARPLHEEIKFRGYKVEQFQQGDYDPPYDQGVHILDRSGNELSTKISNDVARAAISAMDDILTREKEGRGN